VATSSGPGRCDRTFIEFTPPHLPFLITNHLPKVPADDPALWARLLVTLFDQSFLGREDRGLEDLFPGFDPLRDDVQVAPVMARVFAFTVVAARHALANIPLQGADRPLAIAQYAEHALDGFGDVDRPSRLERVASFAAPSPPRGPNEELEAALRGWPTGARRELARTVPAPRSCAISPTRPATCTPCPRA